MATTDNVVELTMGYSNTDKTRVYRFAGLSSAVLEDIAQNVNDFNANIVEADKKVFISDDYDDSDPQNVIGEMVGIVAARSIVTTEEEIPLL